MVLRFYFFFPPLVPFFAFLFCLEVSVWADEDVIEIIDDEDNPRFPREDKDDDGARSFSCGEDEDKVEDEDEDEVKDEDDVDNLRANFFSRRNMNVPRTSCQNLLPLSLQTITYTI